MSSKFSCGTTCRLQTVTHFLFKLSRAPAITHSYRSCQRQAPICTLHTHVKGQAAVRCAGVLPLLTHSVTRIRLKTTQGQLLCSRVRAGLHNTSVASRARAMVQPWFEVTSPHTESASAAPIRFPPRTRQGWQQHLDQAGKDAAPPDASLIL